MLREAPSSFTTLAAGTGELSSRAAALLARIGWPGKPGMPSPVTPLTPEEETRYAAGEQIYKSLCIACHQADGRGMDKLAPTLIGSTLALGPAHVAARIVLNGKEGTVGLMPPLGATMSDADVAAVLTYVRRAWGQGGEPVAPSIVADTRAATKARARPWTEAELRGLAGTQ